jgi:hypothetical protein
VLGKRKEARTEEYVQVTERLRPYVEAAPHNGAKPASDIEGDSGQDGLAGLVERAETLLAVMPRNQQRDTLEALIAPSDPDRARRAIDVLIESDVVVEESGGRLRLLR